MIKNFKKKEKQVWKAVLQELFFEFYTQVLMQNQFSFFLWVITYLIGYIQLLDFLFHYYYNQVSSESFVASFVLSVLEYSSVTY